MDLSGFAPIISSFIQGANYPDTNIAIGGSAQTQTVAAGTPPEIADIINKANDMIKSGASPDDASAWAKQAYDKLLSKEPQLGGKDYFVTTPGKSASEVFGIDLGRWVTILIGLLLIFGGVMLFGAASRIQVISGAARAIAE